MTKSETEVRKILFIITLLILIGITVGFSLGTSFQIFKNQVKPEQGLIYSAFVVDYIILGIELISVIIGAYILIKNDRKNFFLLLALIIACFEYLLPGIKFTFLLFELGITLSLGTIGIGINFIGIILLIWYSMLKQEKQIETNNENEMNSGATS